MKKILPMLLVGVLVLSGLGAVATNDIQTKYTIFESVTLSEPTIKDTGKYIAVDLAEATSHLMGEDKPNLPVVTEVYTFPLGTKIDDVNVTFSEAEKHTISKYIKPASVPQLTSTELNKKTEEIKNIYLKEKTYPEKIFSYNTGAGLYYGEHLLILSVHLCPISYQPSKNTINIFRNANIKITYTKPDSPIVTGDKYDLLILAPPEFSDELQPLVDYKNDNGVATTLTTLDEIPSQGVDQQEDIKYFIKDAYENWGITYVLLVGSGVEGEEKFPVRNAWVGTEGFEEFFPSDLYYADFYDAGLGFSDWDDNNNGKYAEFPDDNDAVDMYPDVYLGRLACNDESEVTNVVNKITNFMEHNSVMHKIVQMGGDTFPGDDDSINEGEYCNEVVMDNLPGYSAEQLWGSNGQLTKINIIQAINNGVDFVDFSGHGSYLSWATHPHEDSNIWLPDDGRYTGFLYINIPWLFNSKKLPVVFLDACSCNKYSEAPNCLGWSFIQNTHGGAIASYGATGIGFGSYGTSQPERVFGWMEVNTLKGLGDDGVLGDVWGNCISEYYTTFLYDLADSDYKTLYEYGLLGDPSLAIETGPDPEDVEVNIPLFLQILERVLDRFPLLEQLLSFPFLHQLFDL